MTETESAYLLQTCGDGLIVREFRAYVKYDMIAYTKPIYIWWEQRRFVYDEDLNEKEFYWGYCHKTEERRWIQENYVQAIYIIDNMSHAIGDVFIKSLFMEFIMNNLREADFMNWLRKVKK